ncbi:TPA: hypothetical protein DDW35_06670 [Candidatus Sumerlaeota bacterium]|jgi:hypothetical protein|nr:hypothetical protein [Candidatus Sumerlaeota bacterium]
MPPPLKPLPLLYSLPAVFALALLWEMGAHPDQWLSVVLQFLPQLRGVFCALLMTALALLLGHGTLRLCRFETKPPLSLSLALGWGLLSLYVCLLAAVGTLTGFSLFLKGTPWLTLLVAGVVFRDALRELIAEAKNLALQATTSIREYAKTLPAFAFPLIALVIPLGILTLLRLGLTALTPSFQYDVLEYHLPAVRQMLNTGTFAPVEGVRYTQMPQAVEALYAFGSLLEGGAEPFAPKLLHLFLALSTVGVLNALLREFKTSAALRLMAAFLFLLHPVTFKSLSDAFVEMGPALFVTAAVTTWILAEHDKKYWKLSAAFFGFAFSCKYTVAGLAIIPFMLTFALLRWRDKKTLKLSSILLVVGGAVYLPWFLRGIVFGHSLFPPLTLPMRSDTFDLSLAQCMSSYHSIHTFLSADWLRMILRRIPDVGALLFIPLLTTLVLPQPDKRRRALALFALLGYCVWCTARNPEDRFLSALLPLLAGLAVLLADTAGRFKSLCTGVLGLWIALLFITQGLGAHMQGFLQSGLGILSPREFQEKLWGKPVVEFFNAIEAATDKQKNPRVLMLFEARAAALPSYLPVEFNTVFDSGPFWRLMQDTQADNPQWVIEQLRKRGITLIAVNEAELARLLATYPAQAAATDLRYQIVQKSQRTGSSFDPAFLTQTKFYPAIYYAPCGAEVVLKRLNAFLQHTRTASPLVWQTDLGGAKLWVSKIQP